MVFDEKFRAINEAAARLYKIADMAELCGNAGMQSDVGYALARLLDNFDEELSGLIDEYGEQA
jgi:hypothetical protein